jgi:hypothetical protein
MESSEGNVCCVNSSPYPRLSYTPSDTSKLSVHKSHDPIVNFSQQFVLTHTVEHIQETLGLVYLRKLTYWWWLEHRYQRRLWPEHRCKRRWCTALWRIQSFPDNSHTPSPNSLSLSPVFIQSIDEQQDMMCLPNHFFHYNLRFSGIRVRIFTGSRYHSLHEFCKPFRMVFCCI